MMVYDDNDNDSNDEDNSNDDAGNSDDDGRNDNENKNDNGNKTEKTYLAQMPSSHLQNLLRDSYIVKNKNLTIKHVRIDTLLECRPDTCRTH